MQNSRCRECGRAIVWIEHEGKKVPLDPKAWTYFFDGSRWVKSSAMVTHLITCPVRIINQQNEEKQNADNGKRQQSNPTEGQENGEEPRSRQWWADRD